MAGYVDPHSHHQFSNFSTLRVLAEAGYSAVACLAYLPVRPSSHHTLRDLFEWLVDAETERLRRAGLRPIVGVGIHPRNVPRTGRSDALAVVEEFLPEAQVLGEVGLETGLLSEREVFEAQLKLADRMDKPVVVHTPRVDKAAVLRGELRILEGSSLQRERVLVDHLTPGLVGAVPEGYFLGLTVQPGKLSEEDVLRIASENPDLLDRLVVDSDCGRDESDPLAVMKTAQHLLLALDPERASALASENARRLLGI